ncbi:MAG: hypothetical protein IIA65_00680 [Planctomycetes bacterium]|nr:hypothetical protein [Planctomycetota bacterium]
MIEQIKVKEIRFNAFEMRTRFPFKYGIASMTELPHLFVTVMVETSAGAVQGIASEGLPPKWFTKNPSTTFAEDLPAFGAIINHAADTALSMDAMPSYFALWRDLYREQESWAQQTGHPPLHAHLGTSLMERAILDALCRQARKPLHELVRKNALGLNFGEIRKELNGLAPRDVFTKAPADFLMCRHTVGLGDSLDEEDEGDAPADGLPFTLMECIRHYGLSYFKIKLCGDQSIDLPRLRRIAKVLDDGIPNDTYYITLDGNEQFKSIAAFRENWQELVSDPALARFFSGLIMVEQPLHRDIALAETVKEALAEWGDRPKIIIDESDASLESLPTALALGYSGTSHKNCKGIVKGLVNAALLSRRNNSILSGEDLSNVGPIALLQDLALMGLLGIGHVERNGHHYFKGLSMYPKSVQDRVLAAHGDLYSKHEGGFPSLRIDSGRLAVGSVNTSGFGYGIEFDPSEFDAPGSWFS